MSSTQTPPSPSQRTSLKLQDVAESRLGLHQRIDEDLTAAAAAHRAGNHTEYWNRLRRAGRNEQLDERLEAREKKLHKRVQANVTHEPPPYAPDSPHSWAGDLIAATDESQAIMGLVPPERIEAAQLRLGQHARDVGRESSKQSDYGRHIRSVVRDQSRGPDEQLHKRHADETLKRLRALGTSEARAIGTGGGITATAGTQASVFVPPAFVMSAWAPFRGEGRPFAEQCKKLPLPAYGVDLYVPFWSKTDKVNKQTEGGAVTEASPKAELESGKLETLAGQVVLTQALHDRGFYGGGSFDEEYFHELAERLAREVESLVLTRVIEQGESVSGEASYSNKGLYKDLALAREKLTDTAGTRLRPTHLFTTSDFYSFASRQVDTTTERPPWQPWFAPGFPLARGSDSFDGEPDPRWSRFTGTIVPGGVLWFTSEMVPNEGTTSRTRLIVSVPEIAVCLFEGAPTMAIVPETYAAELKVIAQLRAYIAVVTRHKAGTSYVQGGAYLSTSV